MVTGQAQGEIVLQLLSGVEVGTQDVLPIGENPQEAIRGMSELDEAPVFGAGHPRFQEWSRVANLRHERLRPDPLSPGVAQLLAERGRQAASMTRRWLSRAGRRHRAMGKQLECGARCARSPALFCRPEKPRKPSPPANSRRRGIETLLDCRFGPDWPRSSRARPGGPPWPVSRWPVSPVNPRICARPLSSKEPWTSG